MKKLKFALKRLTAGRDAFSMRPEDRISRYLCYKDIQHWLHQSDRVIQGDVLCISGVPPFVDRSGAGIRLTETRFPDVDIHDLPYPDHRFDWVISDQVLEHVQDPRVAVQESHRVLKPGGIAIHMTVSTYMQHDTPGDFWRFMPEGLTLLCADFAKIHRVHFWGSRGAVRHLLAHPRLWEDPSSYVTYSKRILKLALESDPDWPIIVWIMAEK